MDEVSALCTDFVVNLAIQEFESAFASFDFQTLEGLRDNMQPESVYALRQALRLQVCVCMCVCVYACVCVFVYIYVCVCIYIYIHTHTHIHTYVHTRRS